MPFVGDNIFIRLNRKRKSEERPRDYARDTSTRGRTPPGTTSTEKQASPTGTPSHSQQQQRKVAPTKRARTATSNRSFQDRVLKTAADTTSSSSSSSPASDGSSSTPIWVSTSTINPVLLLPCHICHRRPLKTTHLDRFTSCQHCGKRACQICIRSCPGRDHAVRDDVSMRSPPPPESEILMGDIDDDLDLMRDEADAQETLRKKSCSPMQVDGLERTVTKHREVICSRCCVEKGADGEVVCYGCLSGMEAL